MLINKILIIIQRSNGDVFLSMPLIQELKESFNPQRIDLLVNDDTLAVAKTLPNIDNIHVFSYKKKNKKRWSQEKNIIKNIYKKYDLSINLTASDRSVLYSILSAGHSISAIEKNNKKSWWKRLLLNNYYIFDSQKHILLNNLEPIFLLGLKPLEREIIFDIQKNTLNNIKERLEYLKISKFIIFHPSAQYNYKIYPEVLRNKLLKLLNQLNISIIVSGGSNAIDNDIKNRLPEFSNVFNWIGKTSIEEYIALSSLSEAYIGMDTLNMHIAALQKKRIFAIFGPTNLSTWAPWSYQLRSKKLSNLPLQTYDNVTIFQGNLPCVACGKAGCDNNQGKSECLDLINPNTVFNEINMWVQSR
jgi:heptosyltransferase III